MCPSSSRGPTTARPAVIATAAVCSEPSRPEGSAYLTELNSRREMLAR